MEIMKRLIRSIYHKIVSKVCVFFLLKQINVQMLNVSKLDSVAKDVKLIKDCITHRMLFGFDEMHTHTMRILTHKAYSKYSASQLVY